MADRARATAAGAPVRRVVPLIEVIANDRLGGKGDFACPKAHDTKVDHSFAILPVLPRRSNFAR